MPCWLAGYRTVSYLTNGLGMPLGLSVLVSRREFHCANRREVADTWVKKSEALLDAARVRVSPRTPLGAPATPMLVFVERYVHEAPLRVPSQSV